MTAPHTAPFQEPERSQLSGSQSARDIQDSSRCKRQFSAQLNRLHSKQQVLRDFLASQSGDRVTKSSMHMRSKFSSQSSMPMSSQSLPFTSQSMPLSSQSMPFSDRTNLSFSERMQSSTPASHRAFSRRPIRLNVSGSLKAKLRTFLDQSNLSASHNHLPGVDPVPYPETIDTSERTFFSNYNSSAAIAPVRPYTSSAAAGTNLVYYQIVNFLLL